MKLNQVKRLKELEVEMPDFARHVGSYLDKLILKEAVRGNF